MALTKVDEKALGAHELLYEVSVALGLGSRNLNHSQYITLGDGKTLRLADHYGNANRFSLRENELDNYGFVIRLRRNRFKESDGVEYLEFVFFSDNDSKCGMSARNRRWPFPIHSDGRCPTDNVLALRQKERALGERPQ